MIHLLGEKMETYALLPLLPQGIEAEACLELARSFCRQVWGAACRQHLGKDSIWKLITASPFSLL